MTKGDLLKALEPFADDTCIVLRVPESVDSEHVIDFDLRGYAYECDYEENPSTVFVLKG